MRIPYLVRLLLLAMALTLWAAPSRALALASMPSVSIAARLLPDGTLEVTERRLIAQPRQVEFLEFLIPTEVAFEITVSDEKGAYAPTQATDLTDRTMRVERGAEVAYVEWRDDSLPTSREVTLTYRLGNALIRHGDAFEWYWPAITGSGKRPVTRVDVAVELPTEAQAYLYAYGGEAGGVRMGTASLKASATDIDVDETFELRLLLPQSALPQVTGGRAGSPSTLETLRKVEEERIAGNLRRAERNWVGHLFILCAPLVLGALYWFTVRRLNPDPPPDSLSPADLTAVDPAVVGWTYDASWLDYACAQLMWLETRGAVRWEWNKEKRLQLIRVPGQSLNEADESLMDLFCLGFDRPVTAKAIGETWERETGEFLARKQKWLDRVGAMFPRDWLRSPSIWPGTIVGFVYAGVGLYTAPSFEMVVLLAVAGMAALMVWKRRHLTALGESHISRWVSAYRAAFPTDYGSRQERLPDVPSEYLLAVEIGDDPLRKHMGNARYEVVRELYRWLDD